MRHFLTLCLWALLINTCTFSQAQIKKVVVTGTIVSNGTGTVGTSLTAVSAMIRDSLKLPKQTIGQLKTGKQDTEAGKSLSTYDFSTYYRSRIDNTSYITGITAPTDGVDVRFYKIAELPAQSAGTYDFADIDLVGKPWGVGGAGQISIQRVYLTNRGGPFAWHTLTGEADGVGIAAYLESNGALSIYVKSTNGFRAFAARVVNHMQAIVYSVPGPAVTTPTGTLTYDTSNPNVYKPIWQVTKDGNMYAQGSMIFPNSLTNRKIVLYDVNGSDHGFYGLGVNSNTLRYQTASSSDAHVWYSGASSSSSTELMRLTGEGRLSIGSHNPAPANTFLDVTGGWASFYGNIAGKKPDQGIGISLGWNHSGGYAENNLVWGHAGWPGSYFNIYRYDGSKLIEQARFNAQDNFGIGIAPSYRLHVGAPNPTNGVLAQFINLNPGGSTTGGTGAKIEFHYGGQSIWSMGIKADNSGFVINGWNGNLANPPEYVRFSNSGSMYVTNNLWAGGAFTMQTPGAKFNVIEGANAVVGVATLSGGTVTINNTSVTASSRIFISAQEGGTLTGVLRVSARSAGTSFTVTSTGSGDTANVAYWIIN